MNTFSQVPPGFRFHPTDEELVDYYLRKKVNSRIIELDVIRDIDLYKIEPWDLRDLCGLGTEDQNEWYFFSHKDKKYPTGTRTNRATSAGFWKATGRDKAIYLKHELIGMRKTLVFYKGRAPNGQKSDWIMHEYRLESDENGSPQEEGWAVCRVFKKKMTTVRRMNEYEPMCWFDDQISIMPNLVSRQKENPSYHSHISSHPCKIEIDQYHHHPRMHYSGSSSDHFHPTAHFDAPNKFLQLTNPNPNSAIKSSMIPVPFDHESQVQQIGSHDYMHHSDHQTDVDGQETIMADWRTLDKFGTSQFSHQDHMISDEDNENYLNAGNELFHISGHNASPHEDIDICVSDSMPQDLEFQQHNLGNYQ